MYIRSFNYIADKNAEILILGSMPGKESLLQQQYYAHPKNIFWDIMSTIFEFDKNLPYKKHLEKLKENKLALWDVIFECKRIGTADSNISEVKPNDFKSFFKKQKQIHSIFFNGKKAEELFRKLVLPNLVFNKQLHILPSTSPANATLTKEAKLKQWLKIRSSTSHSREIQ